MKTSSHAFVLVSLKSNKNKENTGCFSPKGGSSLLRFLDTIHPVRRLRLAVIILALQLGKSALAVQVSASDQLQPAAEQSLLVV